MAGEPVESAGSPGGDEMPADMMEKQGYALRGGWMIRIEEDAL